MLRVAVVDPADPTFRELPSRLVGRVAAGAAVIGDRYDSFCDQLSDTASPVDAVLVGLDADADAALALIARLGREHAALPVVAVAVDERLQPRALAAGARAFVSRSVTHDDLIRTLLVVVVATLPRTSLDAFAECVLRRRMRHVVHDQGTARLSSLITRGSGLMPVSRERATDAEQLPPRLFGRWARLADDLPEELGADFRRLALFIEQAAGTVDLSEELEEQLQKLKEHPDAHGETAPKWRLASQVLEELKSEADLPHVKLSRLRFAEVRKLPLPSAWRLVALVVNDLLDRAEAPPDPTERERLAAGVTAEVVEALADAVECTVFAPPAAAAGDTAFVQVFAHTPEQADEAAAQAGEFDDQAERRGCRSLDVAIQRDSKLMVHLVVPGLDVDDPVQPIVWRGRPASVQFGVSVPAGRPPGTVVGTVTISQESVPVGHVKFKLTITAGSAASQRREPEPAGESARRYRKAFVSYASPDRDEVLKRVQMLRQMGIDCFQDVLSLEPGTRWEKQLYRHIDDCDLFLLFWSKAAQQSQWVLEEMRYALKRKGDDDLAPPEIKPVVLEGPPPPKPPPELAHLHFNDFLVYLIGKHS